MKLKIVLVLAFLFVFNFTALAEVEIKNDQTGTDAVLSQAKLFIDPHAEILIASGDTLENSITQLHKLSPTDLKSINGYKNSKVWMLFSLRNKSDLTEFFIRYAYPSMQHIEAFVFNESGVLVNQMVSGKLTPFEKRPVKDTDYLFPVKFEKDSTLNVLMSFQSTGSMQLPIEILSTNRVHELTQTKYLIYGLYYGVILLILMYTVFLSITLKGSLYKSYLFYILSVVFAQMGLHGISYRYIWPEFHLWNKISTIFFVGLMFFALSIFSTIALDLKRSHRFFHRMMSVFTLISGLVSLSALFMYGNTTIRITGLITSALPIIIIPPGIAAWRKGQRFAPYYLAAVFFYIIGASLYGLKDSGLLSPNFLTENGILIGSLLEISIFSFGIAQHIQSIQRKSEDVKLELERARIISQVASQVSHDIRSPLSALNMLMASISELSEEKRILVRNAINRITDIANSLLEKSKKQNSEQSAQDKKPFLENTLLAALVDSVVSEKRIQMRDSSNKNLEAHLEKSYGLFASINPMELKRVLSNTINNSVEAFDKVRGGTIDIYLSSSANMVLLKLKDNGKGIPQHILKKLGEVGVTYGKEGTQSGSGLGVYHAKKTIESFGGTFEIESSEGLGTTITISLPAAAAPDWFVQELKICNAQSVVVTDDDNSVLEVWRQRLSDIIATSNIELITCSTGSCLSDWITKNPESVKTTTFLMDFELLGQQKNGLDLIEELKIADRSILVTSRYEESPIKDRCKKLGVRLIPKGMVPLVPITVHEAPKKVDGVLIDNDPLVDMVWTFSAKDKNKNILCFESEKAFIEVATSIDPQSPIYIDVDLGNGVRGQDVAQRIYSSGFKNIRLTTGYESESIQKPEFIFSVVGKEFPL